MQTGRNKTKFRSFFSAVVFFYAAVSLFFPVFHRSHENPLRLHEDCPACIFQVQTQDTHQAFTTSQVIKLLKDIPRYFYSALSLQETPVPFTVPTQDSRAPPLFPAEPTAA